MAWEKVAEYTNPAWYNFSGEYTKAVVTFQTGPEQLTWVLTNPIGQWLGDQIQGEAQDRGQTILFYSLQKNTDPTWTTDWQVDLWGYGSPLLVVAIVAGALVALGIAYSTFKIVSQVQETKRAEIQQMTEQARIEATNTLLDKGYSLEDINNWLAGITKPPPEAEKTIKDLLPAVGISTGVIIVIALLALFFLGRRS